jgi:hypothetical protein
VNEDRFDPTKSPTEDYLIADNIFYSTNSQVAAIRIDAEKAASIVVKNNLLRGENRRVLVEGDAKDKSIVVQGNE